MDGLAGDQLCQWNSVAPDSILPATHLTLFLPPPLRAFVLANHQSHEDFKSTPSATQATPIFSVQQHLQFPLPLFFLLVAAWVRSRAERPSVSYTKVSAVSLGLANSCNYTNRNKFKQNSGSNKFLIAGDGKMKRMREP